MPGITKARSEEVQSTARQLLDRQGGVMVVDKLPAEARKPTLVAMARQLQVAESITYQTARNHVAKAMRRARGEVVRDRRGGQREGAGAPKGNTNASK